MITPRTTRLLRVPDLQALHETLARLDSVLYLNPITVRDSEFKRLLDFDPARLHSTKATRDWMEKHMEAEKDTFWFSIQSARERVYVTNPYFVPDEVLQAVIEERARAGVDVRFLVPGERIDLKPIRWASHSYFEDLLEAVVGEIEDEHDSDDEPLLLKADGGALIADARVEIEDIEKRIGIQLSLDEDDEVDTLGGLVFTLLGRVPKTGEVLRHPAGVDFEVLDADRRRVKKLRIKTSAERAA